jgi:hypothetical protein
MARSLYAGSLAALVAAVAFVGCSDGESATSSSGVTTGAGGGSTSSTTGGGGEAGATTTIATTSGTGGAGGEGTGAGGAGGDATTGTGGGGGMASGTGGAGGSGGAPGVGGAGGAGGSVVVDVDADGDGWTPAQGDCCDTEVDCGQPELVNPGAFEYLGNGVDDDCDASSPDDVAPADCSVPPASPDSVTSSTALIKALDLCQFTLENLPLAQKKWGVISSSLVMADQSVNPTPNKQQVGVLVDYGQYVDPVKGPTMAALSTGTARDEGDAGHVYPQNGIQGQVGNFNAGTQSSVPAGYLVANGGSVPSPEACPACNGPACTTAFDPVNLKARIRVPTNALSFTYSFKFYSAEFPEFVCQSYNDFFITLLTTGWQPGPNDDPLPLDKNIALDAQGNAVSVNNAFFEVCFPPPGAAPGTCPAGTLELIGTGMGGWPVNGVSSVKDGGGTVWLKNDAPVVPGETIEIEWIIWDAGDHNVDSLVLLDKFRWNITPSTVGVHK